MPTAGNSSTGMQVTCLDSRRKKTEFIRFAAGRLGIGNVRVETGRVEHYSPETKFDTLVCRAFASLEQLLRLAGGLCRPGGRILAMKGRYPKSEIASIETPGFPVQEVVELRVPGLDRARHLVLLTRILPGEK